MLFGHRASPSSVSVALLQTATCNLIKVRPDDEPEDESRRAATDEPPQPPPPPDDDAEQGTNGGDRGADKG